MTSAERVVAGLTALALSGCRPSRTDHPPLRPRHLLFVTIDTLRADRLGCYGSTEVATPHLDRLSREGAMAPDATVQVPLTRPSHVSIFTGLYPAEHGIRDNVSPSLEGGIPTLAEVLKRAGFETAGFVSSIVVSAQSGLSRGFDTYSDRFEVGGDDARFLNTLQKRGDGVVSEAVSWMERRRGRRWFEWVHLYDPHDPYEPPEPYASRYAGRPYDGEVAWSDELVGRLDAALDRLGARHETLMLVTSDHGEGLGEHGEAVHGFFVYEATLRVPLLFRGPGIPPGTRLPVTARSIDLFPTVLDLLGISQPPGIHLSGRSLAGMLRGGPALSQEATYAESLLPRVHYGWSDLRALREGRFKYILAPRPELYDLKTDPAEGANLVMAQPERAAALRRALEERLAAEKTHPPPAAETAAGIPQDLLEKLGALGYVGMGAPHEGSGSVDPKDKLEDYKLFNRLIREGLLRLREADYAGSASRLGELHRRGIDSFEVHYYLGRALLGLRRFDEASHHFRRAILKLPGFGPAHLALADCAIARGDLTGAVGVLHEGEKKSPKDARLPEREAQVWRKLGKRADAVKAFEAAVALQPRDPLLRVQLGEACRDTGDLARAISSLREAVSLDSSRASYWNSLGMVLGAKGELSEAEKAFREAWSRDSSQAEYAYNLGLILERQGRNEEARTLFRKVLDLEPGFAPARERLREARRAPE